MSFEGVLGTWGASLNRFDAAEGEISDGLAGGPDDPVCVR